MERTGERSLELLRNHLVRPPFIITLEISMPDERAIMVACQTGDRKALSAAIDAGANLNFVFPQTGETPLTAALKFSKYELVEPLIYNGMADVNMTNAEGQTPLHLICLAEEEKLLSTRGIFGTGKGQVMMAILRNRPNINARDARGRTPLHYAVLRGERTYICQLFRELPDVSIRDSEGLTPEELMISMAKADVERLFASRYDRY